MKFTCPNCEKTNHVAEGVIDSTFTEEHHWLILSFFVECPVCKKTYTWDETFSMNDKTNYIEEEF